jgi:hypothetical protein
MFLPQRDRPSFKPTKKEQNYTSVYFTAWPASWSSGQSLWLLIMRSRFRFPALPWEFSFGGGGRIPMVTMVWVVGRFRLR